MGAMLVLIAISHLVGTAHPTWQIVKPQRAPAVAEAMARQAEDTKIGFVGWVERSETQQTWLTPEP